MNTFRCCSKASQLDRLVKVKSKLSQFLFRYLEIQCSNGNAHFLYRYEPFSLWIEYPEDANYISLVFIVHWQITLSKKNYIEAILENAPISKEVFRSTLAIQ
eukprot:Protomagalhaensia_sp_Gyna_25__365@NODE_1172_length_2101_cov_141_185257_g931_i0_p3_GENE_NODE_1172_length_2101_cov_141_185257_g931_i0NODE_1172_length_2101_cov_141_185257_g931_i0_p3_ORF_typecomplete_len102_score8_37_NODE_1172_length_2101_cov_141_185257_g931_i013051610